MASYLVGQRVRLARHLFGQRHLECLVGSEGVIESPLLWVPEYEVLVHNVRLIGLRTIWCMPAELEPIQYDGNTPVEWSACLWAPETEKVTA